jgi:hypothetical protein
MATNRQEEEREMVEAAAQTLPVEAYAAWQRLRVPHRISVHKGCVLVLWKACADGTPDVVSACEVVSADMSFERGVSLGLKWRGVFGTQEISQVPSQLHPDVFAWCPYHNDVRWLPHPQNPEQQVLRLSLVMKMRSHPSFWVAGDTYLTPVGEFRHKWPQYASMKF